MGKPTAARLIELSDAPGRKRYVNDKRAKLGKPKLQYPALTVAQTKLQEEYDEYKAAKGGGKGRGRPTGRGGGRGGRPATNLHSNSTGEPEKEAAAADTPWMADFRELAEQLGLEGPVLQQHSTRSHVLSPAAGAPTDDAMDESYAALLRGWPELRMHMPTPPQPPTLSLHAMSTDVPEPTGDAMARSAQDPAESKLDQELQGSTSGHGARLSDRVEQGGGCNQPPSAAAEELSTPAG